MTIIFSAHYALWYGALTSIFGYEGVYARHYTNATTMQYGYLNMILPFITVIVTPLICSLADRRRAHRSYFTISLLLTTISLAMFASLPLMMDKRPTRDSKTTTNRVQAENGGLLLGPWIYYCLTSLICNLAVAVNTCLSDSFAVLQAEENKTSFGKIVVWGCAGFAISALVLSFINQWNVLPRLVPGLVFGTAVLALDVIVVTFYSRHNDFKLDTIPIEAARTLTGSTSPSHREPSDYMPLNESAKINLGMEIDAKDGHRRRRTQSPVDIVEQNMTKCPRDESLSMAQRGSNLDGQTVMLGSSVLETVSSESNYNNNNKSVQESENKQQDHETLSLNLSTPGLQLKQLRQTNQPPTQTPMKEVDYYNKEIIMEEKRKPRAKIRARKQKEESVPELNHATSLRMQMKIFCLILKRRKSLIRYLVLFTLSGFFMSVHWNYYFFYLDQIYHDRFEFISAISMINQAVLGELPFFILSRKFIDFFGRSHTLSFSLISIGIRFILYLFLPNVNMYSVAIADAFQGPNYGLFYVVMTEVGLEYSYCDDTTIDKLAMMGEIDRNNKRQVDAVRLSLRSTVQSVAFACYEGIGVGLGSLVGGWLVGTYGFEVLWLLMAFGAITVGMVNIVVELACKELDIEEESQCEQYEFMMAHRNGTLEKIAKIRELPMHPAPPIKPASPDLTALMATTKRLVKRAPVSDLVKVEMVNSAGQVAPKETEADEA